MSTNTAAALPPVAQAQYLTNTAAGRIGAACTDTSLGLVNLTRDEDDGFNCVGQHIQWVELRTLHCMHCIGNNVADSAEVEADKMFDCTAFHPDCAKL